MTDQKAAQVTFSRDQDCCCSHVGRFRLGLTALCSTKGQILLQNRVLLQSIAQHSTAWCRLPLLGVTPQGLPLGLPQDYPPFQFEGLSYPMQEHGFTCSLRSHDSRCGHAQQHAASAAGLRPPTGLPANLAC